MINGRNKSFAWSMTNGVADTTDLWEEEVNEEVTKYRVDGEWRELKRIPEQLKVKGKGTIEFDTILTHRGVLVDYDTIKFDKLFPKTNILAGKWYSLGWPMMKPGDNAFDLLFAVGEVQSVKEAFELYDRVGKDGF